MGPPKKGTKAYTEYLARNAAKRRFATKTLQKQRLATQAKPFVKAALRQQAAEHNKVLETLRKQAAEHNKVVDNLTRRSNKHFQEASSLRQKVQYDEYFFQDSLPKQFFNTVFQQCFFLFLKLSYP
jgi:anion-transporting  ArsA/GET3 family ATPase